MFLKGQIKKNHMIMGKRVICGIAYPTSMVYLFMSPLCTQRWGHFQCFCGVL